MNTSSRQFLSDNAAFGKPQSDTENVFLIGFYFLNQGDKETLADLWGILFFEAPLVT